MPECPYCLGNKKLKCPRCDGYGTFTNGEECYYCKGERYLNENCSMCNGTGQVEN